MQPGKPNAGLVSNVEGVVPGDFPETTALPYGLYFKGARVQGGLLRQALQGRKLPLYGIHQCLDFVEVILVLVEILVADMVSIR